MQYKISSMSFLFLVVIVLVEQISLVKSRELPLPDETTTYQTDVCEVWKNSEDAKYSYFVSISSEQGLHFCSGVLVAHDVVLASYSCFQRILMHEKNTQKIFGIPKITRNIQKEIIKNVQDVENFPLFEIQNSQIRVRTSVDNCATGQGAQENNLFALVQYGIVDPKYQNINLNSIQINNNKQNLNEMNLNDLVMLKLNSKFLDVPVDKVSLNVFDRKNFLENENFESMFEILTWVVDDVNFLLQFGYTDVFSSSKNQKLECSKKFLEQIQYKKQVCNKVNFICGNFELPDIQLTSFHLHSGDLLVQKNSSDDAKIFGMFSEDFIFPSLKTSSEQFNDEYYTYSSGKFSLEKTGSIFYGFSQKNIKWVYQVLKIFQSIDNTNQAYESPWEVLQNAFRVLRALSK